MNLEYHLISIKKLKRKETNNIYNNNLKMEAKCVVENLMILYNNASMNIEVSN